MFKENKIVFKDLENARFALRSIEGKGTKGSKVTHQAEERPKNPYKLPDSWGEEKKVFKLPIGCNRVGFFGDTQIPFHDNTAIKCLVEWYKEQNVNTLFINGDLVAY